MLNASSVAGSNGSLTTGDAGRQAWDAKYKTNFYHNCCKFALTLSLTHTFVADTMSSSLRSGDRSVRSARL